jgi:hypothetical protein
MLSTIGPFLLAIVTIIWIGFRGGGAWSAPICGNCRRDLRRIAPDRLANCPRCGADLAEARAVLFLRGRERRWGLVVWAAVLLLMPFVGMTTVFLVSQFVGSSPGNLRAQSTQVLVEQRLPNQVDEPWVWNELESRLNAGSLSQQEVEDAIKQLIAHMKSTHPEGYDRSLSWQDGFLRSATQAGKISDPVLFDLCDALYGTKPVIRPLPRLRENNPRLEIRVEYGNTFDHHNGLAVQLLWAVKRVHLDGVPLDVRQNHKHGDTWSGSHEGSLPVGDHEVTVEVEAAYIDRDKLIGLNTNDLPGDRWPKARKRWTKTVSAPLKVYTQEETIVPLSTNRSRDPRNTGGIRIQRCVVQADRDDTKKIVVKVEFSDGLAIPLSCDVAAELDGQTIKLGRLWVVRDQNRQSSGGSQLTGQIDVLDASTKYTDIILTPNPAHIEQRPEVSEIWGEEIVLPGIPIERLDLELEDSRERE